MTRQETLAALLEERLPAASGWRIDWQREVVSSNGELLRAEADPPRLLLCDFQSRGRGRGERSWHCPPGEGLLFSHSWMEQDLLPEPALIGHRLALAGLLALEALAGEVVCAWKWPNDLFVRRSRRSEEAAKLAGILVQSQVQGRACKIVCGMGINLLQEGFPDELRQPATSLFREGRVLEAEALLVEILAQFGKTRATSADVVLEELGRRDLCAGKKIRLEGLPEPVEGEVLGYASDGAIRLQLPDGPRTFHNGEVRLLP